MERQSLSQRHWCIKRRALRGSLQTNRSPCDIALALTKDALWIVVLLSSLALWAAIWAGAASLASAWLQ